MGHTTTASNWPYTQYNTKQQQTVQMRQHMAWQKVTAKLHSTARNYHHRHGTPRISSIPKWKGEENQATEIGYEIQQIYK